MSEALQNKQDYWSTVKRRFKKNKRAYVSLYIVAFLAFVAVFSSVLANDKPLYAKYNGNTYYPVFKAMGVSVGVSKWQKELLNVEWKDLEYEKVIWPPVPYSSSSINNSAVYVKPFAKGYADQHPHLLGTDAIGRDVMAGIIHGTKIAFMVGFVSMGIAFFIGIIVGGLAGYFGDNTLKVSRATLYFGLLFLILAFFYAFQVRSYTLKDSLSEGGIMSFITSSGISILIFGLVMTVGYFVSRLFKKIPFMGKKVFLQLDILLTRGIEVMVSIPTLILIMSVIAVTKPSLINVMAIIGLTGWTGIAKFIRAELLRVRNLEYIEATKALGFSYFTSLFKHALPNALSPVFIALAFGMAGAILTESFLSFLGLGVPIETVTWGSMLSEARSAPHAWWLVIFPGVAIFMTVTLFNLIGEGLTDAIDPKG